MSLKKVGTFACALLLGATTVAPATAFADIPRHRQYAYGKKINGQHICMTAYQTTRNRASVQVGNSTQGYFYRSRVTKTRGWRKPARRVRAHGTRQLSCIPPHSAGSVRPGGIHDTGGTGVRAERWGAAPDVDYPPSRRSVTGMPTATPPGNIPLNPIGLFGGAPAHTSVGPPRRGVARPSQPDLAAVPGNEWLVASIRPRPAGRSAASGFSADGVTADLPGNHPRFLVVCARGPRPAATAGFTARARQAWEVSWGSRAGSDHGGEDDHYEAAEGGRCPPVCAWSRSGGAGRRGGWDGRGVHRADRRTA